MASDDPQLAHLFLSRSNEQSIELLRRVTYGVMVLLGH